MQVLKTSDNINAEIASSKKSIERDAKDVAAAAKQQLGRPGMSAGA